MITSGFFLAPLKSAFLLFDWLVVYWVLFTVRRSWEPRINQQIRARQFDLKQCTPYEAVGFYRRLRIMKVARAAVRVTKWAEFTLSVVLVVWGLLFIVATAFGTIAFVTMQG